MTLRDKIISNYSLALDKEKWSEHYNLDSLDSIVKGITTGQVSVWSEELVRVTRENEKVLEIGCGSGTSSLWLAKHNRKVTALDYTESSIALLNTAAERLGQNNVRGVLADATKPLPFENKEFDMAFQSGLLEHFSTEQQIELLKSWKKVCKRMISMVPNAASIPYRVGKQIMEDSGAWGYGLEVPKHSMAKEFAAAGIAVEKEYFIGTEWALRFLPPRHYIRKFFARIQKDVGKINFDDLMQGYLIVKIGNCEREC